MSFKKKSDAARQTILPRETVKFHFPDISRKAKLTAICALRVEQQRRQGSTRVTHPCPDPPPVHILLPTRRRQESDTVEMENETQKRQRNLRRENLRSCKNVPADSFLPSTYLGELRTKRNKHVGKPPAVPGARGGVTFRASRTASQSSRRGFSFSVSPRLLQPGAGCCASQQTHTSTLSNLI